MTEYFGSMAMKAEQLGFSQNKHTHTHSLYLSYK